MLNIVTLLLEFVPCCQMYLFHHVRCVGVPSDSVVKTEKKKIAWLLDKTSLCSCAYGPVFQPVLWFSLFPPLPSPPHTCRHLCNKARPAPFPFHFCFDLLLHWSFETQQQNKGSRLCCVLTFMLMQVSAVVFKPTWEPLAALEGKITYIALTS